MLIGYAREFIQSSPCENAEATEVREEMLVEGGRQVQREKLLQAGVDREEVLPGTIWRYGRCGSCGWW